MSKYFLWLCIGTIITGCGVTQKTNIAPVPAEITQTNGDMEEKLLIEPTEFTARFEIYTHGTKREFTQAMYHNQSKVAYIDAKDPSLIQVKKADITWGDFFETLPFSLTQDCLVTGTGQTFCTGDEGILRFYLNNKEAPNALEQLIGPNELLEVVFSQ